MNTAASTSPAPHQRIVCDSGGTLSLLTDAQGKTHGQGLLMLEIDVPPELIPTEHGTMVPRTSAPGRAPRASGTDDLSSAGGAAPEIAEEP